MKEAYKGMNSFIVFITVIGVSSGQFIDHVTKTVNVNDVADVHASENDTCYISINETSSKYLQHNINLYKPNFARLELRFRYVHGRYPSSNSTDPEPDRPYLLELSTSFTEDAIRPYEWVWTYYSPDSFFPYLKWPTDFSIVSFGLLGAKTLQLRMFLVVEVHNLTCYITIGQRNTTRALSSALRDLTRDFLINPNSGHQYDYTYWCYLSVVPGIKDTTRYQFGIHIGYPVEFVRYNCCRTEVPRSGNTSLQINCSNTQISEMWQGSVLPYALGVLATAFFPLLLFSLCAKFRIENTRRSKNNLQKSDDEDWDLCQELSEDWIFLDGKPPLSFTNLFARFFGLGDIYPVVVARIWRSLALLCGPIIVYFQLWLYYNYQYKTTLDMIDHGFPMGYLSMLAGFEKSRRNFMPVLGGPYCLLMGYHIAGIVFIVAPTHLDRILHDGCNKHLFVRELSPLFYSMTTIEYNSHVTISDIPCGYKRAFVLMKTMFHIIFNPTFWLNIWRQQIQTSRAILGVSSMIFYKIIVLVLVLPMYISMCVLECMLTVVYYGVPYINALCIVVTGYFIWISGSFPCRQRKRVSTCCRAVKYMLMSAIACLFLYFIVSVFTLLSLSFAFLGKVVVFCFISVVVYPSTSFGYLFFGIVFVYYIFKMIVGFGDDYLELLADAIEVSSQMENGMYSNQIIDNVLIIDDLTPSDITKIQVRNHTINLSSIQRRAVHDASTEPRRPKLIQKNHCYGIPRDLFKIIVQKHRPAYIQVTHALLKIGVILTLIMVAVSVILLRPSGPSEGISEMMHVVFIIAVGALPRVLEVAMDGVNHRISQEIHQRELRTTINQYWCSQYNKVTMHDYNQFL